VVQIRSFSGAQPLRGIRMARRILGINRTGPGVRWGLLALLLLGGVSLGDGRGLRAAELGPEYSIEWHTTQVGGGASQGGEFSVAGTVGQADTAQIQGGEFAVNGGYWNEQSETNVPLPINLYLPWISR